MQTDLLRLLEKYHFLRLEDIEDKIQDYINTEKLDSAISYLHEVSDVYVNNRQAIIGSNSFLVAHFVWMHEIDREFEMKGEKYQDGSKYRFDHEIRNLIQKVEDERKNNSLKNHDREEINDIFEILHQPEKCFRFLIEVKKPLINDNYECALKGKKGKAGFIAWWEILMSKGYVKKDIDKGILRKLLMKKISGLEFGKNARIFDYNQDTYANTSTIFEDYMREFKAIIQPYKSR